MRAFSTPPPPPGLRKTVRSLVRGGGWPKTREMGPSFFDGSGIPHTMLPKFRPIVDRDLPDADVVVATWWQTAPWVWRLGPQKGAKAYFLQHHEGWAGYPEAVDRTWRLPMHKIVISKWLAEIVRDKFGDADVSYVPNSVDMTLFNAPPRCARKRRRLGLFIIRSGSKAPASRSKRLSKSKRKCPTCKSSLSEQLPRGIITRCRRARNTRFSRNKRRSRTSTPSATSGSAPAGAKDFTSRCLKRWHADARSFRRRSAAPSTTSGRGKTASWLRSKTTTDWHAG